MSPISSRRPLVRSSVLSIAAGLVVLAGCRGNTTPGGGTPRPSPSPSPNVDCPGEGSTICALKNAASARHPSVDSPVTLTDVVVTTATAAASRSMGVTTLATFFVQDPAGRDFLDGRFSGIAIVYKPGELVGDVPEVGSVVTIEGAYKEFGQMNAEKQKQVQAARITSGGRTMELTPVAIQDPSTVGKGGQDAAAYEGVLISLAEVQVTNTKAMTPTGEIFGAFRINADLVISGLFFQYSNPQMAEQFTAISGVLRLGTAPFDMGEQLLTPRTAAEVQPKNAATVVRSIAGLLDPSSPDRPMQTCENPNGQAAIGKCARADLKRVVVAASGGYVSTNLRALFVMDPSDQDGRYSGIKVVYNRNNLRDVPRVGQYVDVTGESILYRGGMQIQFPTITRNGTDTATITPWVVPASEITRKGASSRAWEGTLVKVENVSVSQRCVEDTSQRDFGNWLVGGDTMIGSGFFYDYNGKVRPGTVMCLTPEGEPTGLCSCAAMSRPMDQRRDGDTFTSITGVVDFSFDNYSINPRGNSDLVRRN